MALTCQKIKEKISHDKQKCLVKGCESTRRNKSFRFPKHKKIGLKWVEASSNPDLEKLTYKDINKKQYVVCHLYFTESDFVFGVRQKLKEGTFPSLCLPIDSVSNNECINKSIDLL